MKRGNKTTWVQLAEALRAEGRAAKGMDAGVEVPQHGDFPNDKN